MVELSKDRKAHEVWVITKTDSEGFHRQLCLTFDEMTDLMYLWMDATI